MLSLTYIFAWYGFLLAVLWALQRLTHWLTQLNIFTLAIGFLVLRHGVTVPFDHTVNQWYAGIDISPQAYLRFYSSLVLMWLSLLASVFCAHLLLGSIRLDPLAFRQAVREQPLPAGVNWAFLVIVIVSAGLVAFYQLRLDANLMALLTGKLSSLEYREMRDNFGTDTHYLVGIGQRLANIARFGLMPALLATLFFLCPRGGRWRLLFLLVLGLNLVVGLRSGQKGASVFFLVTVALAYYYRSGRVKLRLVNWRLWVMGATALLVIVVLYRLQYPQQSFAWAWQATTYRLTSESNRSLQLYYEIYPDVQPFLHGKSSGLVNTLLRIEMPPDSNPERFIPVYYLGPEYLNTWNGAYIGVAWADFGYYGVVFQSLFVGGLLYAYALWFRNARQTALVMGTQVGLLMASTRLSEVALSASLLTFGLLSGFLIYVLVKWISVVEKKHSRMKNTVYAHPSGGS
jgi:oligosaccharide repeat unit polymerase